jgi:hypothetical protein
MQVVNRMQEVGLVQSSSADERRGLTVAAHFAYGMGTDTAFGFLRQERGEPVEEAAVGAALALLAWGAGWASWLPLVGVGPHAFCTLSPDCRQGRFSEAQRV